MAKIQEKLIIQGGDSLKGEVAVGGAKNAVLKINGSRTSMRGYFCYKKCAGAFRMLKSCLMF